SLAARELAYWKPVLHDAPGRLELPVDRPHGAVPGGRGARLDLVVPAPLHAAFAELTRTTGATPFMQFTAALAAVLSRLGCGDDITVGVPITGPTVRRFANVVGFLT